MSQNVIEELKAKYEAHVSAVRSANRSTSDRDEYEDAMVYLNKKDDALRYAVYRHLPALLALAECCRDARSLMIMDPNEHHMLPKMREALSRLNATDEGKTP